MGAKGGALNELEFFNDPSWMDFEGPVEPYIPAKPTLAGAQPAAPGTETTSSRGSRYFHMDSPIYPPRSLPLPSPVRSVPSRGYRRGNTISSYHQPSPRYPMYPRKQSWERMDWDDVHFPNYEEYSDSEFDRPRSPPRGQHQSSYPYPQNGYGGYNTNNYRYGLSQLATNARGTTWRGVDRRANSRSLSQLAHKPDRSRKYPSNISDRTNNSDIKDTTVKPAAVSLDVQRIATKLSNVNKQILFENYDGKVFNTKEFENNNNIDADAPIETIPLLLDTKRRNNEIVDTPLVVDDATPYSDRDNRDEVSMEIEDPESPNAQPPPDKPIEEHVSTTETEPNKPSDEDVVAVEDVAQTPALHLPVRVIEQPKSNKVHIRMNIQLSPPKIILNATNNLETVFDDGTAQLEKDKDPLELVEISKDPAEVEEDFTLLPATEVTKIFEESNKSVISKNADANIESLKQKDSGVFKEISKDLGEVEEDFTLLPATEVTKIIEDSNKSVKSKNADANIESLKRKDSGVFKDESNSKKYKRSSCDNKKHKPSKSSMLENAPPSKDKNLDERGLRKHKSGHHANSKAEKSKSAEHKEKSKKQELAEESKPSKTDKRRNSSVKERHKRRASCEEQVAKEATRRWSITESFTCISDKQTSTKCSTVMSVINEVASNITDPHMRNLENIMDSLRKYDPYLSPSPEVQSFSTNFLAETRRNATTTASELGQTLMCDNEIEQIISKPAKLRRRRCATLDAQYNRSNSMEESCSSSPKKIIKRRRTIVDASEAGTKTRRSRSRNNNKYQEDPDFKAKVERATTPVRITRSKSKEILSRCNSMDALVPQTPDDPDFFQQNTPPATPRTPRLGDTPDFLRTLNMKSVGLGMNLNINRGLDVHVETQDIGHVYAPSLFAQYDFTARLDPRLNRMVISSGARKVDEEDGAVVDEITLQNTLANKVSAPEPSKKLTCPADVVIVVHKLTDKQIGEKQRKLKQHCDHKQEDSNNFPCSIPIAAIGIPELTDSANVVDDILKLMDSGPISTKDTTPKIRKSIDQLESSNPSMPVDNAMTKPLSSKPVKQTAAIKTFDTFAAVSADSEQTPRPQLPAKPETKERKMRRLFEVEAKKIYMPTKKNKVADNLLKKKKKEVVILKQFFAVEVDCQLWREEVMAAPMTDFLDGVDVGHAEILSEPEQYLCEATALPTIATDMSEKAYSPIYEDDEILQNDGDTEIMNIDEIFDNEHDVGNLTINGEPPERLAASSATSRGEFQAESKTSVTAARTYETPTVVATIDLLTKEEEEAAALAQQRAAAQVTRSVQDSILIVPVIEYAMNVTAIIGQYVQMEKLRQRTIDMVKKSTASFALDVVNCEDSVDDFRKSYSQKLGKKFVDYTDSIEIQNFSVTILYTTLTESCLKYNAFNIKKLDVATSICDLYNAVGQQHKRSVFCKQLFQLSNHMKEIELSVELERIENQNNLSRRSPNPPTMCANSAVPAETTNATLVPTIVALSSKNRTLSTCSTASAHTPIPSPPVAQVTISPVPCSSNSPESFSVAVSQSSPELGVPAPEVVLHHTPVMQTQSARVHQLSTIETRQALVSTQNVVRPSDNLTSVINSVAQDTARSLSANMTSNVNNVVPQPLTTTSSAVSGISHTVVVSQGRQTVLSQNPPNRRRFKYTAPLQLQNKPTEPVTQKMMFSVAQLKQYNLLCQAYNNSVQNYYHIRGIQSPTRIEEPSSLHSVSSNRDGSSISSKVVPVSATYVPQSSNSHIVAALRQQPKNLHNSPDTRALMNFRPDVSKRPLKNSQFVPIPSVVPPVANYRPVVPPNPRIAVRNINQLRQPTQASQKRPDLLTDEVIQTMIAEIEDSATQSCATQASVDQQQTSARVRSTSNGEEPNTQSDPIARSNLSRDSGHSSDEPEESRDAALAQPITDGSGYIQPRKR